MENIKNSINTNSSPSDSNRQAISSMPNPFGPNPFAAASSKVQQVKVVNSLIPSTIENLIQLNPKERLRTIMRMPASVKQDAPFCNLAQNKYLDGKSRLAAAMKLKDSERRNTLLIELAKDQSLKGTIRLKAVDKISNFEKRKEIFAELAQDKSLSEIYRTEAELSLEFKIELEEVQILEEAIKNKNLDKGQKAKPVILIEAKLEPEEKLEEVQVEELVVVLAPEQPAENNAIAPIQIDPADLERKERAFLAIVQDKDLDKNLSSGSPDQSYRLKAALKLAPSQRREEALAFLAQDKDWGKVHNIHNQNNNSRFGGNNLGVNNTSTYTCSHPGAYAQLRLEAALALAPGQRRENVLALLAQDKELNHFYSIQNNDVTVNTTYCLEAALALIPGQRREEILALIAQDKDLKEREENNFYNQRLNNNKIYYISNPNKNMKAALALAPGQRRENVLALLAQDKDFMKTNYFLPSNNDNVEKIEKNCSLEAALALTPGQQRENVLALLAQDRGFNYSYSIKNNNINVSKSCRLEVALALAPGQRREDTLALLAQDSNLHNTSTANMNDHTKIVYQSSRLEAALALAPGQRKEEILALLAQDKNLSVEFRLRAANSMAGGQAEEENQQ